MMKIILQASNASIEVGWVKGEKQLCIICVKAVVQGKGGGESTERNSVHEEKQMTENSLRKRHKRRYTRTQKYYQISKEAVRILSICSGANWRTQENFNTSALLQLFLIQGHPNTSRFHCAVMFKLSQFVVCFFASIINLTILVALFYGQETLYWCTFTIFNCISPQRQHTYNITME